jgi:flagellar assembly factor FliW
LYRGRRRVSDGRIAALIRGGRGGFPPGARVESTVRTLSRPQARGRECGVMIIETSRFGGIEVDDQRFLNFPKGLLGFPDDREYALIQTGENSAFYWMQAVHRPELAFVVCDPRMFVPDYRVAIKADDLAQIGLADTGGSQVFVIVNKVDEVLTGNLQGPLVINVATRVGKQLVLSEKRFSTRHPLMRLPEERQAITRSA